MRVFIVASQTISPQDTFLKEKLPVTLLELDGPLKNVKVDFKAYFNTLQSRRINRLTKTCHACAVETIAMSGLDKPDAIITGSGLGCVESTEKFLNDMLQTDEGLVAPTAFIHSTSNAIGGQIALHFDCKGYNVLYAQKSYSFENALSDAVFRLKDGFEKNILLGGFDELTDENYALKQSVGLYKKGDWKNTQLLDCNNEGSMAGEGAAFFLLSTQAGQAPQVEIAGVHIRHANMDVEATQKWLHTCLEKYDMTANDVDVLLSGYNGDADTDSFYGEIATQTFEGAHQAYYKHMCGEYDTATAFGMWVGADILKSAKIPDYAIVKNANRPINNVLIYNQLQGAYHAAILLKRVEVL